MRTAKRFRCAIRRASPQSPLFSVTREGIVRNLNRGERVLLVLCIVVVFVGVWMVLTPSTPASSQKVLLSPEQANMKADAAEASYRHINADFQTLDPKITRLSYDQSPDEL